MTGAICLLNVTEASGALCAANANATSEAEANRMIEPVLCVVVFIVSRADYEVSPALIVDRAESGEQANWRHLRARIKFEDDHEGRARLGTDRFANAAPRQRGWGEKSIGPKCHCEKACPARKFSGTRGRTTMRTTRHTFIGGIPGSAIASTAFPKSP